MRSVQLLLSAPRPLCAEDGDGDQALLYACAASSGSVEAVEELLRAGPATCNHANQKGLTPLHAASRKGNEGICRALLASGANATARDEVGGGQDGRTCLLG